MAAIDVAVATPHLGTLASGGRAVSIDGTPVRWDLPHPRRRVRGGFAGDMHPPGWEGAEEEPLPAAPR
jgi:hypothetical protein